MVNRVVVAVAVVSVLCACPGTPGPDGGVGGGTATGGGTGAAFDAGHLDCTFETATQLGEGSDTIDPRAQVAVTESGYALYAWNAPNGALNLVVQSPDGTRAQPISTLVSLVGTSLVARGDRAMLVTVSGTQLQENRFRSDAGLSAPGLVGSVAQGLANLTIALEADGHASLWRQDTNFTAPWLEVTSDGVGTVGAPQEVIDAGFLYATTRANGTRLAVGLRAFNGVDVPEAIVSTSSATTRTPLTGAVITGNDLFKAAIADDGTAVVTGVFNLAGGDGLGAIARVGGTWSAPLMVTTYADGGLAMARTMGALAGPEGRATVVWWQDQQLFISRLTGSTWSAPQSIATTNAVVPRWTQLDAARGLVHFLSAGFEDQFIEVSADGSVGTAHAADLPGYVFGTEYAGAGRFAAAIETRIGADGGYLVFGQQCR